MSMAGIENLKPGSFLTTNKTLSPRETEQLRQDWRQNVKTAVRTDEIIAVEVNPNFTKVAGGTECVGAK